ncbi:MAG: hypothetical protein AAGA45_01795 [Verrucomicrobiota bacterium]
MKKSPASLIACIALLLASFLLGCTNTPKDVHPAYTRNHYNKGFNVLGIVDYSPESYQKLNDGNGNVRTKELVKTTEPTGDNLSLLWGLVVLADY